MERLINMVEPVNKWPNGQEQKVILTHFIDDKSFDLIQREGGCTGCAFNNSICPRGTGESLICGSTSDSIFVESKQKELVVEKSAEPTNALNVQVGGGHYKNFGIQPVEYIHANNLSFLEGNVVKYITRHKAKNGIEDIKKVIHYCQLIMELEYNQKETK